MAVKVLIPTALRQYANGQNTIDIEGAKVGDVMDNLKKDFPDLVTHLFSEDGQLRSFVNVYVNEEDIRFLHRDETALKDGDEVSIIPAIAGG